jgi:dihydrofolate synthase/folylpolyglutamate synthase
LEKKLAELENGAKGIATASGMAAINTVYMAFLYFERENVDVAVIETGMGGRLDSTNIIHPVVSVITNIGLDHTRFLGETLPEIAREKAGIIKREVPVIIGEYHPETFPVFEKIAKEKKSEINVAEKNFNVELASMNLDRTMTLRIKDSYNSEMIEIKSDLTGSYQKKNILTVLETIAVLNEYGWDIKESSIYSGLSKVQKNTGLRGRWEEIGYNPLVIADTAHNAEGVSESISQLTTLPYKTLHILWAMVSDKNPQKILKLLPTEANYYFTKADIPRSLNEIILSEMAGEFGLKGQTYSDSSMALKAAREQAKPEDVIFIGGSTFLVGKLL